jgi:predicted GIY-YIG superfamily endonuclease
MTTNIYIIKLDQGKYYVGKTKNVAQRYQEHLLGQGSSWTRKYKPLKLDTVIENASPFDEDKQVKIYMAKYGIENVRGGTYVADKLSEEQEQALKAEIWGSSDLCNKCGRPIVRRAVNIDADHSTDGATIREFNDGCEECANGMETSCIEWRVTIDILYSYGVRSIGGFCINIF